MRRLMGGICAALVAAALATPPAHAKPTSVVDGWQASSPNPNREGPPSDLKPGDIVTDAGGVSVIVPPGGPKANSVAAEAILSDGTTELLQVTTHPDGFVTVSDWGSDAQHDSAHSPSSGTGSSPGIADNACSDSFYQLHGAKWTLNTSMHWLWKSGSQPSDVSESSAVGDLKNAAFNITNARNDCGRSDNVDINNVYDGSTTRGMNITSESTCGTNDGYNVVGFGDAASSHLGVACIWYTGSTLVNADQKLNKFDGHKWYAGAPPFDCLTALRYHIQSVGTHEFGHMYGLWHYSDYREIEHPWLTMSPNINGPCQSSEMTLGYGDILGLERMY